MPVNSSAVVNSCPFPLVPVPTLSKPSYENRHKVALFEDESAYIQARLQIALTSLALPSAAHLKFRTWNAALGKTAQAASLNPRRKLLRLRSVDILPMPIVKHLHRRHALLSLCESLGNRNVRTQSRERRIEERFKGESRSRAFLNFNSNPKFTHAMTKRSVTRSCIPQDCAILREGINQSTVSVWTEIREISSSILSRLNHDL
ncbi:hypothetical protein EAG_09874 [Camponotus floridanus]|uniref:Uncharacterized protein n=1 Tax=Camponotus floridanus TaxID=104421 RepID=E2A6A0_CAMFO|nr:hypothetical protein EAG_09874 [Camponotus floridanus]